MFLGPLEQYKPWDIKGISGVHNFLKKLWRLTHDENNKFAISNAEATKEELKSLHQCIKKVTIDLDRFSFNTVVSHLMICLNELIALKCNKREILREFIILLAPYTPFICEEIWESFGYNKSITYAEWPIFDEQYIKESLVTYPISFNGKMRFKLDFDTNASKIDIEKAVYKHPKTKNYIGTQKIKKIN